MKARHKLTKFESNQYYSVGLDETIKDSTGASPVLVSPLQKGRELISKYYSKKYATNIHFPGENINADLIMYYSITDFAVDIQKQLEKVKVEYGNEDCRIAFFIGAGSTHATPIIYMRENGKEGILYADSKGTNEFIAEMLVSSGVDVYAIKDPRQKDMYSCYTDALLFGRDATARNPKTGDYYIHDLLTALQSRAEKNGTYYFTKLPDELLKTSQLSSFTTDHHGAGTDKIIHKHKKEGETLNQFRERYTDKNMTVVKVKNHFEKEEKTGVNVSSYARRKGVKFADMIEIQFYIDQIQKILGKQLPDPILLDFVDQSKKILQEQGSVTPSVSRKGLHQFATVYISSLLENKELKSDTPNKSLTEKESSEEELNQLKEDLRKFLVIYPDIINQGISSYKLKDMLIDKKNSLGYTSILLRDYPQVLSPGSWAEIAKISPDHALLVLNHKTIANDIVKLGFISGIADGRPIQAKLILEKFGQHPDLDPVKKRVIEFYAGAQDSIKSQSIYSYHQKSSPKTEKQDETKTYVPGKK